MDPLTELTLPLRPIPDLRCNVIGSFLVKLTAERSAGFSPATQHLALIGRTYSTKILAAVLLALSAVPTSYCFTANDAAKTIASDGSYSDTQAAVNYVAGKNADDWVLTVGSPGGSYSWSGALNINVPKVFTLKGASATNRPSISSTSTAGFSISISCTNGKTITVRDLKFTGSSAASGLFGVHGSGVDCFRFTNCEFTIGHKWSITILGGSGGLYGLVDNCAWLGGGIGVLVRENSLNSWRRPMSWGTKNAVYIEDCRFTSTTNPAVYEQAFDGWDGSRIVFRYNTLQNYSCVVHGADSAGPLGSSLQVELMHNTFTTINGTGAAWAFYLRGGTAVVFDNTLNRTGDGFFNWLVYQNYYRATGVESHTAKDRFYPQDYIGTMQPGSGYIGITGKDPKHPSEPWGSVPVYVWGNRVNAPLSWGLIGGSTAFEQLNRDYFVGIPKPGYTEYPYPHSLRGGTAPSPSPGPPSNLRIISGP